MHPCLGHSRGHIIEGSFKAEIPYLGICAHYNEGKFWCQYGLLLSFTQISLGEDWWQSKMALAPQGGEKVREIEAWERDKRSLTHQRESKRKRYRIHYT